MHGRSLDARMPVYGAANAEGDVMNRADLANYCMSKHGAVCEQPFGPEADVFKVMGKMFALMPVNADLLRISLKCDPTFAEILRQTYPAVTPAYHMNKLE